MRSCCVSALSYRRCVNGHQGGVQKYSTHAPHLEAGLPLPHTFRGGSCFSQRSPKALLSFNALPRLMLGAQLLESSLRGREKKEETSHRIVSAAAFPSCRVAHWREGCFRPFWKGARSSWKAAPRADAMWTGQNPSIEPISSTCLTSLRCCREYLALEDKALCVAVFSLASSEDYPSPEISQECLSSFRSTP